MTLSKEELFSSTSRAARPRITPAARGLYVATFGNHANAELLVAGCPVVYNKATGYWDPYTQPSDAAIYTITAGATAASAGSFQLLINGLAITFAFDVAAAAMQTALRAALVAAGVPDAALVACVATTGTDLGDNDAVITVTLAEAMGAPNVQLDASGLTGAAHALAQTDAGTALSGTNKIGGFVWEESIQIDATLEKLGIIMVKGEAEREDINTAAIRALLRGSPSEAELDAALGDEDVRKKELFIRGLSTVH